MGISRRLDAGLVNAVTYSKRYMGLERDPLDKRIQSSVLSNRYHDSFHNLIKLHLLKLPSCCHYSV